MSFLPKLFLNCQRSYKNNANEPAAQGASIYCLSHFCMETGNLKRITLALTYSNIAYCQGLFSQLSPWFKTKDIK